MIGFKKEMRDGERWSYGEKKREEKDSVGFVNILWIYYFDFVIR